MEQWHNYMDVLFICYVSSFILYSYKYNTLILSSSIHSDCWPIIHQASGTGWLQPHNTSLLLSLSILHLPICLWGWFWPKVILKHWLICFQLESFVPVCNFFRYSAFNKNVMLAVQSGSKTCLLRWFTVRSKTAQLMYDTTAYIHTWTLKLVQVLGTCSKYNSVWVWVHITKRLTCNITSI